ncbi:MAG: serine/threonine-protein kinase [Terriglobales bacterium]
MDDARWQRIQEVFHRAADLSQAEQSAFLKAACGDDEKLLSEVMAMLRQDSASDSLLDGGVANVAQEMFGEADSTLPFKEFGPYRVVKLLGEGGMGVVYLAERKDLGSEVAIKILRDAWISPARRERFAIEQRTLAQLNHPSIARLYDAATLDDGTPWFVMEYVEGVPLTRFCRERQCSIEDRLRLFRSVCEAVEHAHGHAVIHRDLKPSNILVKSDGTVRLLDFGIAKQLESLDLPADQTMTGLRLMTPAYAAPEQIRGDRIGVGTDVYSLGVILFELLTGQLPFDLSNLTPAEAATIITEHEPGKPSLVVSRIKRANADVNSHASSVSGTAWTDLDVLCLTAMHKDVQRRYRSVEALMRDVDHYLNAEPLEARPDTLRYRTAKFVRRNRRAVAATVLVLSLVVGLVVFFTVRLTRARNAALAEAARTQRIQKFMTNLFQGGDAEAGPADDLRVVTLVDRGVLEAQSLSGVPKIQAEIYGTLGGIYEQMGKLDRADSLLSLALERRKALFGADSAEVAESLVALGQLRSDQAKLEEAEQLVRQGLEMTMRHVPPGYPAVGKATAALGTILENRGEYDQAIQVLEEASRLQSAPGASEADLGATLSELANSQFYAGHYDISNSINQRVLATDRRIYGERHPQVANDLINLGAIQYEQGHYPEAEKYQREALDITQGFYGKNHPETASAMTHLARSLVSEKRPDEAANLLQEALVIQEHAYGKVHPRVAHTLNELGRLAQQQGKLHEAEADFQRMADIYRSVYAGKHYYIGIALSNLAGVCVAEKKYPQAESLFREALRMYAVTLSADHELVGIARIRLGNAILPQRRYAEAEAESRAGYDILIKHMDPNASWLVKAREDLVEEYVALKEPEQAAKFRTEMASAGSVASNR